MYIAVGAIVVVVTIVALLVMTWFKRITTGGIVAVGVLGIFGGLAIPNLAVITELQMSGTGMTAKMQHIDSSVSEAARIEHEVETLAQDVKRTQSEVKASAEGIATLVRDVDRTKILVSNTSNRAISALNQVKGVERRVAHTHDSVQRMGRSFFESSVLQIGTRNIFPIPQKVGSEIDRHLDTLAIHAWPDKKQRATEFDRIYKLIKEAQGVK